MSELKAYRIKGVTLGDFHDVYLKSEADKVIEELKEKLKNSRNAHKYWRREYLIEYKECCHQKFKRCLAMAMWCDSENYTARWYHENSERCEWTEKWKNHWLKIAEQFKEAK